MIRFLSGAAMLVAALLHPAPSFAHAETGAQVATGAGRAGDPARITRTVVVGMADSMRFRPAALVVPRGETLRITARNDGAVMHEIVFGTRAEIAGHRAAMQRDPAMAHGAPYMAHVAPGASEHVIWQFDRAGTFEYACLLPGHYEAGMTGSVTVR